MADVFWVGTGSSNTWAAITPTNWSATSGGSIKVSAPTTTDRAIFDGNSGVGNSVLGANTTIQGLVCDGSVGTGAYAGTLTHNTGVTLTINTGAASSVRFSAGMTYTPATSTSIVTLTHTTGTANITSNGQKFAALNINGAGGTTQILDALQVNAVQNAILTVTNGIFDANGGAGGPFAVTSNLVLSTAANTRSLILGGLVKIGGNVGSNQNIWSISSAGTFTFTKNSANIEILAPTGTPTGWNFLAASFTYNNLTLDSASSNTGLIFNGSPTFSNLTINSGWGVQFSGGTTTTISNAFTWTGTQANPIIVASSAVTSVATISVASGACTMTWGGLQGITGSSAGGATFTATNTFNFGSNSGWSISPPADATTTLSAATVTTLNENAGTIGHGVVTTGGSTTSVPTSAFSFAGVAATGVVSNQLVGRSIVFDGNTTTNGLRGAAATILATSTSNTPTFTVGTLPATPASGDTFTVV